MNGKKASLANSSHSWLAEPPLTNQTMVKMQTHTHKKISLVKFLLTKPLQSVFHSFSL